jgi:hypothetical protein
MDGVNTPYDNYTRKQARKQAKNKATKKIYGEDYYTSRKDTKEVIGLGNV